MWLSLKRGGMFQKCGWKMCTTLAREPQNEKGKSRTCTTLKRNARKAGSTNGHLGVINL